MKYYYQQLYTSQGQTSPDQLSDFLNSGPLPRLDDVSQNLCEGSITEAECLSAIKAFLALWLTVLITGLYKENFPSLRDKELFR